jgi:hypothetical protein
MPRASDLGDDQATCLPATWTRRGWLFSQSVADEYRRHLIVRETFGHDLDARIFLAAGVNGHQPRHRLIGPRCSRRRESTAASSAHGSLPRQARGRRADGCVRQFHYRLVQRHCELAGFELHRRSSCSSVVRESSCRVGPRLTAHPNNHMTFDGVSTSASARPSRGSSANRRLLMRLRRPPDTPEPVYANSIMVRRAIFR